MIRLMPIGHVESPYKHHEELEMACLKGRRFRESSKIIIEDYCVGMLKGLEEFSHAWILFHLHKADRIEPVTHPGPPEMKGLPKVGVLASRSQFRPNHIGMRLVNITGIEGNTIRVTGLDAMDGTPVIDIKPYVPHFDLPESPKVAGWYKDW